jgi:xylulokinase
MQRLGGRKMSYLGIDIGTSSIKAVLLDEQQQELAEASVSLTLSRPHPGWSEQDPEQWWEATLKALGEIRAMAPDAWARLAGIGLSGQMHGAVLLDAAHRVLRPAILWNDGRSAAECIELMEAVPDLPQRAANIAMPGFTAPKLLWVRRHEPDIFKATAKILLPKDYIRWRLTRKFAGDMSDAAGTLWLDVAARRWDPVVLAACDLTEDHMPSLVEGSDLSAYLSADLVEDWGLSGRDIPVAGGAGDNAASAVGIGAVRAGQGFLSLGTSGVLFAVTDRLASAPERTLHAFCHAVPERWHAMAVMLSAASSLSWAAELVGRGHDVGGYLAEIEAFAGDAKARANAPIFLPYLSGERTPHNDAAATGMLAGLRAGQGAAAIGYAVLEGVAFGFADGLAVLEGAGAHLESCMLVGGGARSAFWAQMLADILNLPLDLADGAEKGAAFGAARLAMLAAEAGSEDDICRRPNVGRRFEPDGAASAAYQSRLRRYRALYPAECAAR